MGVGSGVQDVRECLRASAVPGNPDGAQVGVSVVGLERAPVDFLPVDFLVEVAQRRFGQVSGCAKHFLA